MCDSICFFFLMIRRPPRPTLFPSTPLFRSEQGVRLASDTLDLSPFARRDGEVLLAKDVLDKQLIDVDGKRVVRVDRKSTRLNSSHANISYAVFCLKKKKHDDEIDTRVNDCL